MQQITQCKYYSFVWAPIRLGPRATAPSAPPLNPPLKMNNIISFAIDCVEDQEAGTLK